MKRSWSALFTIFLTVVIVGVGFLFRNGFHRHVTDEGYRDLSIQNLPKPDLQESPPSNSRDSPHRDFSATDRTNLKKIEKAFSAHIDFYGKVVDQHAAPVPGANVYYSAADTYFGKSSIYRGVADSNGLFSLSGVKGAGLYVEVSKDGYDRIANESYGSFGYGVPSGRQPPSKIEPAIFVLRRKQSAEALIFIDTDIVVPKKGNLVDISLHQGKRVSAGMGDLTVELWAADEQKNDAGEFEWRFRLAVPGGGLIRRNPAEMQFEAPENNYQEAITVTMAPGSPSWSDRFDQEFFVKLRNETFARLRFRITPGGDHFASITSYLNPAAGSRNLEYDPAKQIVSGKK